MSQIEIACSTLLALLEKHAAVRTIAGQLGMDGRKSAWRDAIVNIADEHPFAGSLVRDLPPDCALLARKAWERWRDDSVDSDTSLVRLRDLVRQVNALRTTVAAIKTFGLPMEEKAG